MNNTKDNLKNGVVWIIVFSLALIGICAFDANFKIIECTACDDGIRKLRYSELNYGLILGISFLLAGIPGLTRMIKKRKKPAYNM